MCSCQTPLYIFWFSMQATSSEIQENWRFFPCWFCIWWQMCLAHFPCFHSNHGPYAQMNELMHRSSNNIIPFICVLFNKLRCYSVFTPSTSVWAEHAWHVLYPIRRLATLFLENGVRISAPECWRLKIEAARFTFKSLCFCKPDELQVLERYSLRYQCCHAHYAG